MIRWLKSLYWRWRIGQVVVGPIDKILAVYIDGRQVYPSKEN